MLDATNFMFSGNFHLGLDIEAMRQSALFVAEVALASQREAAGFGVGVINRMADVSYTIESPWYPVYLYKTTITPALNGLSIRLDHVFGATLDPASQVEQLALIKEVLVPWVKRTFLQNLRPVVVVTGTHPASGLHRCGFEVIILGDAPTTRAVQTVSFLAYLPD